MGKKNEELAKKYGNKIKKLREFLGLTQEDFATKIQTNQIGVARWESGNSLISTDFLAKICNEFGISMSYWDDTSHTNNTKNHELLISQLFEKINLLESKISGDMIHQIGNSNPIGKVSINK